MSTPLQHPGADPACPICRGLGLFVVRDGERARAADCTCRKTCPRCRGTGFISTNPAERLAPRARCACAAVDRRAESFDQIGIPARHADSTLANFDAKDRRVAPAMIAVTSWLDKLRPGQDSRGLVLYGDVGRGKTHLLVALLREAVLVRGLTARFVEFSHLLADLKSGFDKKQGPQALMEPLVAVDLLAIDELGKGRNTEFEGTVLDELVSRRYNAARTIVGTTNFSPGAPTGKPAPSLAQASLSQESMPTLADRVGPRVYSRLHEMCDFIPVNGDDWRASKRKR